MSLTGSAGKKGKPVARVGDSTSHGGRVLTGHPFVNVNGRPQARVGDKVSCPKCGDNEIVTGVPSVSGADHLVAVVGSKTACGATITSGSPDTFAAEPVEFPVFMYSEAFRLVNEETGQPVGDIPYVIFIGKEMVAHGKTTDDGRTSRVFTEDEQEMKLVYGSSAEEILEKDE